MITPICDACVVEAVAALEAPVPSRFHTCERIKNPGDVPQHVQSTNAVTAFITGLKALQDRLGVRITSDSEGCFVLRNSADEILVELWDLPRIKS